MSTQIIARCPITVRIATPSDVPFIDSLQKLHSKMVGWMPTQQIEGKIKAGHVIIAEDQGRPVGYCMGQDQYFKRDDVGIIYQLNVMPMKQRNLIGAMLIKAMFDRAAYGCKLFCCWCAQDIEANYFWESLGFIPLAFRSGSRGKKRMHVFWQRRIRAGDETTPFWFPAQTSAGSIREDRLVLPIPPGVHWKDVMPALLPGQQPALPEEKSPVPRTRSGASAVNHPPKPRDKGSIVRMSGVTFGPPPQPVKGKPKQAPKPKLKNDPRHVAVARELRDRYLEQFNSGLILPQGKYEVTAPLPSLGKVGVAPLELPHAA